MLFTPDERRALMVLLGLLALGLFAHWIAPGPLPPEGGGDSLLVLLAEGAPPAVPGDSSGGTPPPGVTKPQGPGGRDLGRLEGVPAERKGPLWINRASADELAGLPRVGPAIAGRIVEMRASQGPFRSEGDLMRVRGIGPKTVRLIAPLITFAIDSGTAAGRDAEVGSTRGDSLGR